MIPDLELVPHCWRYSRLLCLQLSSLVLYPPKARVLYRPCVTTGLSDPETWRVLNFFCSRMPPTVALQPHVMEVRRLVRRGIGRNECAKRTEAPRIGFIDCDYVYGPGDIDALLEKFPEGAKLAHPGHVRASTYERGMEMIGAAEVIRVFEFDLAADFTVTQRMSTAIGGLQFFDGDWCRAKGYCDDEMGSRRMGPADRWQRTKEDRKARLKCGEDRRIKATLFYRVRHNVRSEGNAEDVRL